MICEDKNIVLLEEKQWYEEKYTDLMLEIDRYKKEITDIKDRNRKYADEIVILNSNIERYKIDLGAYIMLANSKDKITISLEEELNYYKNMKVIKLHSYIVRVLKYTKKIFNKIFK